MPSAISTDGERSILELPEVVSSMKATMAIDGSDVLIRGRVLVNDRETPEVVRASRAGAGVLDRPRVDDCSAGVDAVTSTAGGEVWLLFSCLEWRRTQHQFAVLSDLTWRPVAEPFDLPGSGVNLTSVSDASGDQVVAWSDTKACVIGSEGSIACTQWANLDQRCQIAPSDRATVVGGAGHLVLIDREPTQEIVQVPVRNDGSMTCGTRGTIEGSIVATAGGPTPVAIVVQDGRASVVDLDGGTGLGMLPNAAADTDVIAIGATGDHAVACWGAEPATQLECQRIDLDPAS